MTKKEIILIFILFIIALIRFLFFVPEKPNYDIAIGKEVVIEGVVIDAPDTRIFNQRVIVKPDGQESNILVVIPKELDIFYGDKVTVTGILETPDNFMTQSGKEFNYERYLANKDIYFIIKSAEAKIISHNNLSWIKSELFKLRDLFMKNIARVIPPPESDLANGLILGARGGFDSDAKNEFITTGTIHIVALSGYNITIVAEAVMKVFGLIFSQTLAIIFGIFIILLFIIMTGGSATAIRAGIMAFIMLFGRMTGRNYYAGRALVIAALLMIAYDIRVITDMSFQLSFLATLGLILLASPIEKRLSFIPDKFGMRGTVASTFATQIFVSPFILYMMGQLSIIGVVVNILVLPFIPLTMLAVFLTGALGFISIGVSQVFALGAHVLLAYELFMVQSFAKVPFASIHLPIFSGWFVVAFYVIFMTLYGWFAFRRERKIQ